MNSCKVMCRRQSLLFPNTTAQCLVSDSRILIETTHSFAHNYSTWCHVMQDNSGKSCVTRCTLRSVWCVLKTAHSGMRMHADWHLDGGVVCAQQQLSSGFVEGFQSLDGEILLVLLALEHYLLRLHRKHQYQNQNQNQYENQ